MSTIPRLFSDLPLAAGLEITLPAGAARHLGTVLRRGVGDAVRLFDGVTGDYDARILAMARDAATLRVIARRRPQPPVSDLRLMLALPKRDALEWVVEKATELGVAAIHPVLARRCVADRVNADRLAAIARAAAEQAERLTLPRIAALLPLHAALDAWDGVPLLVAAERRDALSLPRLARPPPVALLVGPEGGFERAELDAVLRRPFAAAVGLGPRILRAETAAVAGLAVLAAAAGAWDTPAQATPSPGDEPRATV